MLPGHLIAEFWATVEHLLEQQHGLSEQQAQIGVTEYRKRLDLHRVGDMIYHNDPKDVSQTIAGILEQGGFDVVDPVSDRDANTIRAVI